MLKSNERECLDKFLTYHNREFLDVCRNYGGNSTRIRAKILKHKAPANNWRPAPLTGHEQAVLSGFLRDRFPVVESWCKPYEVVPGQMMAALKRMVAKQ